MQHELYTFIKQLNDNKKLEYFLKEKKNETFLALETKGYFLVKIEISIHSPFLSFQSKLICDRLSSNAKQRDSNKFIFCYLTSEICKKKQLIGRIPTPSDISVRSIVHSMYKCQEQIILAIHRKRKQSK
jgi:hypothetical protein